MSVKHALLGLLAEGPSHGYELKVAYDESLGPNKPVHYAQIYSTLSRLLRDDLVGVIGHETEGGPERIVYELTDAGREHLQSWLLEPERPDPYLQPVLLLKLLVAHRAGIHLTDVVDIQRRAHLDLMRQLTEQRRTGSAVAVIAADYALFHLEADLRWLDMTQSRIADLGVPA